MSGHSKWAQIKHKKAATDAKKSANFSKLTALITVAAREKGGDSNTNPKLRMAVEKAHSFNMPAENIERAIKKGTGELEGIIIEELFIEAYGPNGKPILITAVTDSKNRTISEIKHLLSKHEGKMAGSGSVKWMFEEKGQIILENQKIDDELELKLIGLGVEDIKENETEIEIITQPHNLEIIKEELLKSKKQISESSITFLPKNPEIVSDEEKEHLEKLFEELDNHQDVVEIYTTITF
jgi:YebC/PmpR family DNA-binding regulatory protein